jgi:hypothetical protein
MIEDREIQQIECHQVLRTDIQQSKCKHSNVSKRENEKASGLAKNGVSL